MVKYTLRQAPGIKLISGTSLAEVTRTIPITTSGRYLSNLIPASGSSSATPSSGGTAFAPPELRFTHQFHPGKSTAEQFDSFCSAEFGADYRSANTHEVAANWKAAVSYGSYFLVSHSDTGGSGFDRHRVDGASNGYVSIDTDGTSGSTNYHVACIHKYALLRFTRIYHSGQSTDEQKDAGCATEFGSDYRAANNHDVAANWKAEVSLGSYFLTSQSDTGGSGFSRFRIDGVSYTDEGPPRGYVQLEEDGTSGSTKYRLACIRR